MSSLNKFLSMITLVGVVAATSLSHANECLSKVSHFDLWKEFKNRGLSDNDRMAQLSSSCSGSTLKMQIVDDTNARSSSKDYSFPVNGVAECKKYEAMIKDGTFLRNEIVSFCTGSRCVAVLANADGKFEEKTNDFNTSGDKCEMQKCANWARTAHAGYLSEVTSSAKSHGK